MKKREWEMKTDHFRLRLVWDEPEEKDFLVAVPIGEFKPPERYVLIGPPGEGALARIDETDARMVLPQLQEFFFLSGMMMQMPMGMGYGPGGPPRGRAYRPGGPPGQIG